MVDTDSYPVNKSRCPKCAERGQDTSHDNLIEYSDGHSFCFACGFHTKGRKLRLHGEVSGLCSGPAKNKNNREVGELQLSNRIPPHYQKWLNSYKINDREIKDYGIYYNESTSFLLFKIKGGAIVERTTTPYQNKDGQDYGHRLRDKLQANKKRTFPKWILRQGYKNPIQSCGWLSQAGSGNVVIVEDVLSGIRVRCASDEASSVAPPAQVLPILGTNINANDLYRLCRERSGVRVWLDRDKRDKALKIASRASQWNDNVRVICSDLDPKEYTNEQIRLFLRDKEK